MKALPFLLFVFLFSSCENKVAPQTTDNQSVSLPSSPTMHLQINKGNIYSWQKNYDSKTALINQIEVPENYNRTSTKIGSFQNWLQFLPVFSEGKKVKLYNGDLKGNQNAHERIINVDVGTRDLQQCADAVMRMRAEFLFGKKDFENIHFNFTNGTKVSFDDWRKGKRPRVLGNKVIFTNLNRADDSYANFKKYSDCNGLPRFYFIDYQ